MPIRIPWSVRPPRRPLTERFALDIQLNGDWHPVKRSSLGRLSGLISAAKKDRERDNNRRIARAAGGLSDLPQQPYADPLLRVYSENSRELRWEGLLSTFVSLRKPTVVKDKILIPLQLGSPPSLPDDYLTS